MRDKQIGDELAEPRNNALTKKKDLKGQYGEYSLNLSSKMGLVVAIIDDDVFGTGGGKGLYAKLLARVNEEILGNKVIRISLGGRAEEGKSTHVEGSGAPILEWSTILRVFRDNALISRLGSLLQENKVDLIHANMLDPRYTMSIVEASRLNQIPMINTAHIWTFVCPTKWAVKFPSFELCDPGFHFACLRSLWNLGKMNGSNRARFIAHHANRYFALRYLLRNSAAVISPSRELARAIQQNMHLHNVYSVPNPLPSELLDLEPHFGGGDKMMVAFYGRLTFEKGAHLIPLLAEKNPDINFHVMGAGPLENMIRNASNSYKNVRYYGFVSDEIKFDIIRTCNAIIVPSLWRDCFPYSALEAFAAGKPVIGFAVGGVQELVEESGCGLLAPLGDVADMAKKIRKIVYDRDLAQVQGKKGRMYVENMLSMSYHAKALEGIYWKVLTKDANVAS